MSSLGPETPRQRMIGVMYLVLLAMLALNVDKEVLNAFTTVDNSLTQSMEGNIRANKNLYKRLSLAAADNPQKAGKYLDLGKEVYEASDRVSAKIEEFRVELAEYVDGEGADPNLIEKKADKYASTEVMITKKRGAELKTTIEEYKVLLLDIVGDDPVMTDRINKVLNTEDPPNVEGVKTTWESSLFEGFPVVASTTLLSKIHADVINSEKDILSYLYSQIDAGSFTFNTLMTQVVPEKSYILEGETYNAKIFIAAVDTTELPSVSVGNRELPINNIGQGQYTVSGQKAGQYSYNGNITYKMPDGTFKEMPFTHEYEVVKPSVTISPLKMNVLYVGVPNPVEISVPGIKKRDLKLSIDNGKISVSGDNYIVYPKLAGKNSTIKVSANIGGSVKSVGDMLFRVKSVPDPVAIVAGKSSGTISKGVLSAQQGVIAKLKDFDFDLKFRVKSFTLSTIKGGYVTEEKSTSNLFTQKQKKLMKGLNTGSKVYIENIIATGDDGTTRKLPAVSFTVN